MYKSSKLVGQPPFCKTDVSGSTLQGVLYHGTSFEIACKMALNGFFGISESMVYEKHLEFLKHINKQYDSIYFENKIRNNKSFKKFCVTKDYQLAYGFALSYQNPIVLEIRIPFAKNIINRYTRNFEKQIQFHCKIPKSRVSISKRFYKENKYELNNLSMNIFVLQKIIGCKSILNESIIFYSTKRQMNNELKKLEYYEEWKQDFG